MSKLLSQVQKNKIKSLILSDKGTPAGKTIGDEIKKRLKLSDGEYEEFKNDIADYVEEIFERLSKHIHPV